MEKVENIDEFIKLNKGVYIHDEIGLAIDELFDILYPAKKDTKNEQEVRDFAAKILNGVKKEEWGSWFYYKWLNTVVHFPPKKEHRMLRTSRNRNLITEQEQEKLYNSTILIAGMSVGSNIVEALVSQGISSKLILIDMDIIEPTNLNRIRSPYHHIGLKKTEAITRKVLEIDPYLEIIRVDEGLNKDNLKKLVLTNNVDILIDEMDDLEMKIHLRRFAKEEKLPVIMAADDGDNALIEVERFDLNPNDEIFKGRIPNEIITKIENGDIPRAEQGLLIGKYFVGFEYVPLRMFESLKEVGVTLPSWPQLGGAAALSGISLAYVAKKIILKEEIKDGQILISLDKDIDLEHLKKENIEKTNKFIQAMSGKLKK